MGTAGNMKEMIIHLSNRRYIGKDLNPDRFDSIYVRGKSMADCARLISEHMKRSVEPSHLRKYAHDSWGNYIDRPEHEGRGVWIVRDFGDKDLIEVWIDQE